MNNDENLNKQSPRQNLKKSPSNSTEYVLKDIQNFNNNNKTYNKLSKNRACGSVPGASIEKKTSPNAVNGSKKETQNTRIISTARSKINCSPDAEVQLLLSTAVTIAAGKRSRNSSQSQKSSQKSSSSISPKNRQRKSPQNQFSAFEQNSPNFEDCAPVNLNNYEYPQLDKILKSEPKCVHIKRIDRSQSVGNSFILHLQSPAIRESLKQDHDNSLLHSSDYFQDQYSLFCLDCCSQYKTVEELSYKVRNYHICNNPASELYNSKCPGVLFLEKQTLGIFCAQCNRFLLQDNKQDDLRQIRDIASTQLGYFPSGNLKKLQQWSNCYSRLNLIKRHFRAWRNAAKNKDQNKENNNTQTITDARNHQKPNTILTKNSINNQKHENITTAPDRKPSTTAATKNNITITSSSFTERITVYDPRKIAKSELLPEFSPCSSAENLQNDQILTKLFKTYGKRRFEEEEKHVIENLSLKSSVKPNHNNNEQAPQQQIPTFLTKGLKNLSNTCYINSVIQALSYLPKFINHFVLLNFGLQSTSISGLSPNEMLPNPLSIALNLQCLLKQIRNHNNCNSSNIVNPEFFVTNSVKTFSHFDNTEQHDVHEFIVTLLDTLMNANDKRNYPAAKQYNDLEDQISSDISKLFRAIFMGELQQLTTCLNCQNLSKTSVPLFPLTVSIEQTNVDLQRQVDDKMGNIEDFPYHLLEDLHEVKKYNLRRRETSSRKAKSENNLKRGNKRLSSSPTNLSSQEKRRKYGGGTSPSQTARSANASPIILPLESLLDDFFKQENLDVYCQKCFESMKVSKDKFTKSC